MSENGPKYHPIIEKHIETDGENIGRMKDTETTHEIALAMNAARTFDAEMVVDGSLPEARKDWSEPDDRYIKATLAKEALHSLVDTDIHNMMVAGVNNKRYIGQDIDTQRMMDEAAHVAKDYDTLQEAAEKIPKE